MVRRFFLLVLLMWLSTGASYAFKTFWAAGGDIHEEITNRALGGLAEGKYLEMIDAANTQQDIDHLDNPNAHFDDVSIPGSLAYIHQHWEAGIEAAGTGSNFEAVHRFGRLIHTVQDFYSHSNYIELHLARGLSPERIPPADWNRLPAGIKTGYFSPMEMSGWRQNCLDDMSATFSGLHFYGLEDFDRTYIERQSLSQEEQYRRAVAYVTGQHDLLHLEVNKDNAKTYQGRIVHPPSGKNLHQIAYHVALRDTRRTWRRYLAEIESRYPGTGPTTVAILSGSKQRFRKDSEQPLFPGAQAGVDPNQTRPAPPPPEPGGPPVAEVLDTPRTPDQVAGRSATRSDSFQPLDSPPEEESPTAFEPTRADFPGPDRAQELTVQIQGDLELEVGDRLSLRPFIQGGTPPYKVVWRGNGQSMETERVDTQTDRPAEGPLTLEVVDSQGRTARDQGQLKVYPALEAEVRGPKYLSTLDRSSYVAQVRGGSGRTRAAWRLGEVTSDAPPSVMVRGDSLPTGVNQLEVEVWDEGLYRSKPKRFKKAIIVYEPLTAVLNGAAQAQVGKPSRFTVKTRGGYGPQEQHWRTKNDEKLARGVDPPGPHGLNVHFRRSGQDFVEVQITDQTTQGRPVIVRRAVAVAGGTRAPAAAKRPRRLPGSYHMDIEGAPPSDVYVIGLNANGTCTMRRGVTMNTRRGVWSFRDGVFKLTTSNWNDYHQGRLEWTDNGFVSRGEHVNSNGSRQPETYKFNSTSR